MSEEKKQEKRKPISIELMATAQAAYQQEAKEAQAANSQGQRTQLSLNPGWGGKGR